MNGRVVILMGSPRDGEHVARITAVLDDLGVEHTERVGSAHRTPEHALNILREADNSADPVVFITVAGMSDALSGLSDANVRSPVIACPPRSDDFANLDVLSSLRTPPGVAPAVVIEPANAALVAAKILGLGDSIIRKNVADHQRHAAERVLNSDKPGDSPASSNATSNKND
jgi:5-(carboxyamino)imidazole ribonucleotide mutase